MISELAQLEFLIILESTAGVRQVENLFFNFHAHPLYVELCEEHLGYPPEEHDTFWNTDSSDLTDDYRLKATRFSRSFEEMDMALSYAYFNERFCAVMFSLQWGLLLEVASLRDQILELCQHIAKGLNGSQQSIWMPTDVLEDYPGIKKHQAIQPRELEKYDSLGAFRHFLDEQKIPSLTPPDKGPAGYLHYQW